MYTVHSTYPTVRVYTVYSNVPNHRDLYIHSKQLVSLYQITHILVHPPPSQILNTPLIQSLQNTSLTNYLAEKLIYFFLGTNCLAEVGWTSLPEKITFRKGAKKTNSCGHVSQILTPPCKPTDFEWSKTYDLERKYWKLIGDFYWAFP